MTVAQFWNAILNGITKILGGTQFTTSFGYIYLAELIITMGILQCVLYVFRKLVR